MRVLVYQKAAKNKFMTEDSLHLIENPWIITYRLDLRRGNSRSVFYQLFLGSRSFSWLNHEALRLLQKFRESVRKQTQRNLGKLFRYFSNSSPLILRLMKLRITVKENLFVHSLRIMYRFLLIFRRISFEISCQKFKIFFAYARISFRNTFSTWNVQFLCFNRCKTSTTYFILHLRMQEEAIRW